MTDINRALTEIHEIQARLAESTRFRGIAPGLSAFTSVFALGAVFLQQRWPEVFQADARVFVMVWGAVIAVSSVIVALEAVSRARRLHGCMADTLLNSAAQRALPFAATAIILACCILTFAPESAWLLPGLWLMLIGLLGFSAVPSLPRGVVWLAMWYFAAGAAVIALAGWSGALHPWMMGLPMVLGQFGAAFLLRAPGGVRA